MRYQEGDKVVPIAKTIGCPLDESGVWENAMEEEQPFLYVIRDDGDKYVLSDDPEEYIGDFFAHEDLIPYVEDEEALFEQFVRGHITEKQYEKRKVRGFA